jgi:uncharacterized protein (TIGR03083 family)
MDDIHILHAGRATVEGLGDRLADVLEGQPAMAAAVSPEWSARDAAAHLVATTAAYAELAAGGVSPIPELTPAAVAAFNAERLADIGETEPRALAKALRAAVGQFLDAAGRQPTDAVVYWHAGIRLDLAQLTGILVAEYVLHGYDIAAACAVPWPISPEHAGLGLFGRGAVLDRVVDPHAARGHTASYLIDLGGPDALTLRFVDGALTAGVPGQPVDCEIGTDPVTLLMVTGGRLSQWAAIALGLVRAGGRHPELVPGFFRLIQVF